MIVVWPLITSKTINPNILPGVCKSLEKYIYIHQLDAVLETANKHIKKRNKKSKINLAIKNIFGRRTFKLEAIENGGTIEDYLEEYKTTPTGPGKTTSVSSPSQTSVTSKSGGASYSKGGGSRKSSAVASPYTSPIRAEQPKIGRVDQSLVSAEPTWSEVMDQEGNVTAIGVKVVPFVIQNEQSLIKLMTLDRYRKGLNKDLHVEARKILRVMTKLANFAWKATLGLFSWTGLIAPDMVKGTVSQDWKNDIILQNTTFKKNMFILLNKMDLEDDFTQNASGVKGLFGLGWTSFVIADDVNKVVSYCMKTYKGMCSQMNYSFIYADGRSQSNVYRDLEDVRKSSGPLFRYKRSKKAMITDDLAQYKLNQYAQGTLVEDSYLSESVVPDLLRQLKNSPDKVASNLKAILSAVKRQNLELAYKISTKLNPSNKKFDIHKLIDKTLRTNPEFKKNYDLSLRVFKNSLGEVPDDILKVGSSFIAMLAVVNKEKNYNIKDDIKKIVVKTRSRAGAPKDDSFAGDLKLAFIFSCIFIAVIGPASVGIMYIIASFIGMASSALVSVFPGIVVIASLMFLLKAFVARSSAE